MDQILAARGHDRARPAQHHRRHRGDLRRLGTDYVDLYQTHWPDHGTAYEETMETLRRSEAQRKAARARLFERDRLGAMKSLAVSEAKGFARYERSQNNFHFS